MSLVLKIGGVSYRFFPELPEKAELSCLWSLAPDKPVVYCVDVNIIIFVVLPTQKFYHFRAQHRSQPVRLKNLEAREQANGKPNISLTYPHVLLMEDYRLINYSK